MKKTVCAVLVLVLCLSCTMVTSAYFDRGVVGVSVGQGSVTLGVGESTYVSVSFSPDSSSQLPGCGMAECPQTCGEKECLDENGECTCNGKTYQTYYAYGSVASSNTSVATADYSDGVVSIYAVSPGEAVITVTGSLRQFNSSSASIYVSVPAPVEPEPEPEQTTAAPPSGDHTGTGSNGNQNAGSDNPNNNPGKSTNSGTNEKGGNGNSSKPGVSAERVNGETTGTEEESSTEETTTEKETEKEKLYTVVKSDKGTIWFVESMAKKTVKKMLKKAKGKDVYVDFQSKDKAETIQYAWEFYGKDLKKAVATDLSLTVGNKAFSGLKKQEIKKAAYVEFADAKALPAKASLFVRVTDFFENDTALYAYRYKDEKLTLIEENLTVKNGYLTISLKDRDPLVLTDQKLSLEEDQTTTVKETTTQEETSLESESATAVEETTVEETTQDSVNPVIWIVIAVVVILAAVGAGLYRKKKKDRSKAE